MLLALGSSTTSSLVVVYYVVGILGGIAVIVTGFVKFIWPAWRRIRNFLSDWEGEEARQGVPERPGVMQRLQLVEFDVLSIKAEVHPNSGTSMKDQLTTANKNIDEMNRKLDDHLRLRND